MISGQMVRLYRKAMGLSTTEFGQMTGLTKQTVLNIENGAARSKSTMMLVELMFDKIANDIGNDKFLDLVDIQREIDRLGDEIKSNKIDITKYLKD